MEYEREAETKPETCCPYRRKIVIGILAVLPEEVCGVKDSELADVVTFDKSRNGNPIIEVRYCPWCGKPREPGSEARITDPKRRSP